MNDDRISKLQNSLLILAQQLVTVDSNLAGLRASVNVLRCCVATLLTPDSPEESLKQFHLLEKQFLERDPSTQERNQAKDVLDALQQWKQSGGRSGDS